MHSTDVLTLIDGPIEYLRFGPDDSPHPPVVLVHGALVDHRLWCRVVDDLAAAGHRGIAPTLPLGSHTRPMRAGADLTPRAIAGMIHRMLVHLELEDVTLVGNDTGGALCQFLVTERPERIGRLVLTNCDAFDEFPPGVFRHLFALLSSPARMRAILPAMRSTALRHSPLGYGMLSMNPDAGLTRSWVEPALTDAAIRRDAVALLRGIEPTDLLAVSHKLPQVSVPVSLVWGSADRNFTTALGRRLAAQFRDAEFTTVPGARTFVPLDDPSAVVSAVRAIAGRSAVTD